MIGVTHSYRPGEETPQEESSFRSHQRDVNVTLPRTIEFDEKYGLPGSEHEAAVKYGNRE